MRAPIIIDGFDLEELKSRRKNLLDCWEELNYLRELKKIQKPIESDIYQLAMDFISHDLDIIEDEINKRSEVIV